MAYYIKGYAPPANVTGSAQVKEIQQALGVKADGVWGPQTDAAYRAGATGAGGKTSGAETNGFGAYVQSPNVTGIEHPSGYSGPGYTDSKGNTYTDYGALVRDDNFVYPAGAKISPNGMYYDTGSGWQYAGKGISFDQYGNILGLADSSVTGKAPGTPVLNWDLSASSSNSVPSAIETQLGQTGQSGQSGQSDVESQEDIWQTYLERELKKYMEDLYAGYAW